MLAEQEFLDELRSNLASGDALKGKLVAAHLGGQSAELQRSILGLLAAHPGAVAVAILGRILDLPIGALAISRTEIARVAAQQLIELPGAIEQLSDDAAIHAVTVLGETRDSRALKPLRRLLISEPPLANLRFTVYEALSKLPLKSGGYILAAGLADRDESVRVAAARAIEKNLSESLLQGISNMLDDPAPVPSRIVEAFSTAGCMRVLERMLRDNRFALLFGDYLDRHPDPHFLERIEPLLADAGRDALADLVRRSLAALARKSGPLIFAVDDSNTVLRMYRAALGATNCELKTFENPFEAIEWAEKTPPDLVFTDLNMPELDGIGLASTLRSNPALPDFPIVMVSTQSYGADLERALNSGVDSFIQKPFRADTLVDAINELTDHNVVL
jgi:CheY-like chemotaxis protein